MTSFLDTVWCFTEDDQFEIVSGIVHSIRSKIVAESGVIESIELCLNEITDNVLVHSLPKEKDEKPMGFVMAQCHATDPSIAIAVYDNGQGIYHSFQGSSYSPSSPDDAIKLALTRNVTSGAGQGRGMWMLSSIVEFGRGLIEVNSGGSRYFHEHRMTGHKAPVVSRVSSKIRGTTLVDFRLKASQAIDIAKALGGHEPVNLWLESHEDNEEQIRFLVAEESHGTGTRYAGKRFRNILVNSLNQTSQKIIIDFEGIETLSSSYADEVIGKLLETVGFTSFVARFVLINLSPLNCMIIDEAMRARLTQQSVSADISQYSKNTKDTYKAY